LNASERGYDYIWQKFREWFIARHPICADCVIVPTTDVHHVKKLKDFPALRLVETNCMGLCGTCHKIRTARGE
jgi:5-methylcytosine-specific restriction enzyme A